MKSVMISIRPKWCERIASGKKTIEVRKTRPKLETPFKVYIYQTKKPVSVSFNGTGPYISEYDKTEYYTIQSGRVVGEFVCDSIDKYSAEFVDDNCYEDIRYHYIDIDGYEDEIIVVSNGNDNPNDCFLCKDSCLTFNEIKSYVGINFHTKPFYGWHISDLVIYDIPKELSEFYTKRCGGRLERPPQSWCYVRRGEDLEE